MMPQMGAPRGAMPQMGGRPGGINLGSFNFGSTPMGGGGQSPLLQMLQQRYGGRR
jgi:hypothetical protein